MRTLAIWLLTKKVPQRFPPPPGLDWPEDGTFLQDGGGRAALVPARRSGPRAAYLHTRARSHRGRREGYSQDEVTVRCAARAAVARRADAAPGLERAADRHGSRARPFAPRVARAAIPARSRPARRGGDAAPLHGAGDESARVSGAHALPRSPRRPRAAAQSHVARPARTLLPAEAALAVRLSPAPDELRRLRYRERDPGRILGESGRCRVQQLLSGRLAGPLARRHRGDRGAAGTSTRGSAGRGPGGTFDTRRTHRHHGRLRVLRELQAPHSAQRLVRLR